MMQAVACSQGTRLYLHGNTKKPPNAAGLDGAAISVLYFVRTFESGTLKYWRQTVAHIFYGAP